MSITDLVMSLNEKELGELGDALKKLPPRSRAKVLAHFAMGNSFSSKAEYHLVIAIRQLLADAEPQLTVTEITSAERQMAG